MVIKILGSGCANCRKLEERAREAVGKAGVDAEIVKVQDLAEIMAFGVMSTPALVVDEEVEVAGRVPAVDEIVGMLTRAAG
ncbi:MAG: TM0996/MTH895 family glutaredoxin-like protein [Coriobacteriia bacterium]|nr:TM0996/MTH895 family glutaredoxin-like protein [Coriobacteriia bacterium]